MKKLFLPIFVLFFVPKFVFAFPYLELPFPGGETWWVSCAYDGVGECDTHAENTKDRYALDFNFGVGNEDCGKIILASASGKVSISNFDGYGNTVDINHKNDYITRYAHLSDFFVKDGQRVLRGQKIGYCGSTGGDWPCHLHFVLYRMQNGFYVPVKPEPMSGYTNFKSGVYYKSDNYYNPTHFTFPSGSSQGMTPNYSMTEVPLSGDYNEWRVQVDGSDPGVDSPSYPAGLLGKHVIIEFSAKVVDGGHPLLEGKVFVEDENGSWNNHVPLDLINDEHNYNEGDFAHGDYNVYRANLSELDRPEAEMRKFSLQLTEGFSGSGTWTFDWIKAKITGWDFKDNSIGWQIRQDGVTNDYYADEFWRINPTDKQPQIMSPDDLMIPDDFSKIRIRYSVANTDSEVLRVYFDIGNGFSSDYYLEKVGQNEVDLGGSSTTVEFNLPPKAIGNVDRLLFDLFDNTAYGNKQIAINKVVFSSEEYCGGGLIILPPKDLQILAQ